MYDDLTIIIPTYNEELVIEKTIRELLNYDIKNIIVVDGGSLDSTIEIVKKFNIKIIDIGFRSGYGDAFLKGLAATNTKYLCKINADGSFDPKYLNQMFLLIQNGNADVVFNSRYLKDAMSFDDTIIRRIGNFFFTKLCQIIFKTPNTDILFNYHISKTDYYKDLNLKYKDFSICTEIPIKFKRKGYKIFEISSIERIRYAGVSKVNAFYDGLKILNKTIRLLFVK